MRKAQYALAYSKCTDTELHRFIADRGLNTIWTTRKAAIRALRAADSEVTFKFLDLSPELCNHVFWYLLTLTEKGGTSHRQVCFPEILCTSRQVRSEAEGILYAAENEIVIAYTIAGHTIHLRGKYLHISINHRAVGVDPNWRLRHSFTILPKSLLRFRRLRLVIDIAPGYDTAPIHQNIIQLNQTLFALSNYLKGGSSLEHLSIDIDVRSPMLYFYQGDITNTLDYFAGRWQCAILFRGQNQAYDPVASTVANGQPVGDLIRICQQHEDAIGMMLESATK